MSKIFNVYIKGDDGTDVDKTWYESSNVKYTECIDKDGELKQLKVVFSNGTQYLYKDVNVSDYLLFREDKSQGKALNRLIKENKYEYEKLDNVDITSLEKELDWRMDKKSLTIDVNNGVKILDNEEKEKFSTDTKIDDSMVELIIDILKSLDYKVIRK